jgi:hypothetical protein
MATRRTSTSTPTALWGDPLALYKQSARVGFEIAEAAAQSFINHQVEIANLKRGLTRTWFSVARDTVK